MRIFTFIVVFITAISSFAQEQQAGYYVTNNGNRIEGYFKTTDFTNFSLLEFKEKSENSFSKLNKEDVSEYGVGVEYRFVKKTFKIDSSKNLNKRRLTSSYEPEWQTITDFLNVLVEGKAELYAYSTAKGGEYFLYTIPTEGIKLQQFVYKNYMRSHTQVAQNTTYIQQIVDNLMCDNGTVINYRAVDYDEDDLINVFENYNACNNVEFITYTNNTGKGYEMKFSVFAGIYNTSYSVTDTKPESGTENFISPGVGVEAALVFPSEKWEVFMRAEFESISSEATGKYVRSYNTEVGDYEITAAILNFYPGVRYNFKSEKKYKLFADLAVGLNIPVSGDIKFTRSILIDSGVYGSDTYEYNLNAATSANIGIGYTYNKKYSIALRYETGKNLGGTSSNYKVKLSRIGLNFIYTF